jgi:hypothetical protein
MTEELPIQRVEVSFVGVPPIQRIAQASRVGEVEGRRRSGPALRGLGTFQPFLETLRGHEVISLSSTPASRHHALEGDQK